MWGSIIGAGISALGSLAGGAMSSAGASANNAQNIASAREMAQFNAAEAAKNRDFQERMSNTAYQRAMADMKSAGLNPVLAYQQGGAGTPGGAQGSGSAAHTENVMQAMGQGVTSASKGAERFLELNQLQADTEQKHSTADLNKAATLQNVANTSYIKQQEVTSAAQAQKTSAETANIIASADNPAELNKLMRAQGAQAHSTASFNAEQEKQLRESGPGRIGQESSGIIKLINRGISTLDKSYVKPKGETTTTPTFFGGNRPKFFWEK
ncbi:MAG: DNA pilot protein [Microvirus sp.]|nr:MAG: DNA pilot protein [Microvirus sp.]